MLQFSKLLEMVSKQRQQQKSKTAKLTRYFKLRVLIIIVFGQKSCKQANTMYNTPSRQAQAI
jgi:hypothetical protein